MSDNLGLQRKPINKEVVLKEDGRYLIYYRFESDKASEKQSRCVQQTAANNISTPSQLLSSKTN